MGQASMNQAPKESHVDNNKKNMLKICQRYVKDMPGVIPRLQIEDNYLKQRYPKDMPGVIPRLQIQDRLGSLKTYECDISGKFCQGLSRNGD